MVTGSNKTELVAKTFRGLEEVLAKEIEQLGGENIRIATRAVMFRGDAEMICRVNYHLRTALRVLMHLHSFTACDEHQLYRGAMEYDWSEHLTNETTFAVDGVLNSPHFNHSQYIALKVKDAIADQFRKKTGSRPSVDKTNPDIRFNLHISGDKCSILLDSSGESLHKRGYRTAGHSAPLNEVLAAGLVKLSGWNCNSNFVDPMCGSGTIVLEAALMAHNIPPGIYRKHFAFEKWPGFDLSLVEKIHNEDYPEKEFRYKITGSDISPEAISIARNNAKSAFLHRKVEFRISSFENYIPPEGGGVLIVNPPYGERLKQGDPVLFHSVIGDTLKKRYEGYEAWVFSGNTDAVKKVGLKPSKKIVLFNGPIESHFHKFSIYRGTKKRN